MSGIGSMKRQARAVALGLGLGWAGLAVPAAAQVAPPAAAAVPRPIDPVRLAAAQAVVDRVFPPGTYRKMMDGTLDQMMASMTDRILDIPLADLARMGGLPEAKLKDLKPATTRQIMAILDPAFDRRMHATMDATMDAMVDLMDRMEPDVRTGVVQAYATQFTTAELTELGRFFATPAGAHYAGRSMLIFTDPAVMDRINQMVPRIMAAMPEIMKQVQAATADLPPPPKPGSLTEKQKADLAALLGVDPQSGGKE